MEYLLKKCNVCGFNKPFTDFFRASRVEGEHRRQSACKSCSKARNRKWRAKNRNRANELARLSHYRNKSKRNKDSRDYYARCGDKVRELMRARNLSLKLQAYDAYGGRFCACCGESEINFLSLDHINNDGNEERRKYSTKGRNESTAAGGSSAYYLRLKNQGYPFGYQVLCMNCNYGKRMNSGVCPHKTKLEIAG